MLGLGEEKPVDAGRTRAARAKNRRVEVKVFSADESYSVSQLQVKPARSIRLRYLPALEPLSAYK